MKTPVDHDSLESHEEYFRHAQTITLKANLFRRFFLYPKISKFLPKKTIDIGCGLGSFQDFKKGVTGIDINPFKSVYFSENWGVYCLYGIFQK